MKVMKIRFIGVDPSTKTGFVALDERGQTLTAKELTGVGSTDPKRMVTLIQDIVSHIQPDDFICLEGFAYGAQGQGVSFQYGLGHGIRNALFSRKQNFVIVTPAQLKKYATGKGNAKKDAMAVPIYKHWGFDHNSDNVRDAYVLAQIAFNLSNLKNGYLINSSNSYQKEVLEAIINPPAKKKRSKTK